MQGSKSYQDLVAELPSSEHVDYLLKKIKTGGLKDRNKACTILARQKGISNRIIANALHASPKTTRKYYALFARHGLSEVFRSGSGWSKSSDEQVKRTKRLLELLHHKPMEFGINRTSWSQVSLAWAYQKRFGEGISRSSIAQCIRKAGFAWKKAKRVLTSPDPQYREKLEVVLGTLHSLTDDDLFFFVDELGPLLVKRRGGRSYMHKDEVPSCPRRQVAKGSVTLVGALSATTNQMTWVFGESKDTGSIIELMELLFNQYHGKSKIYVTWDAVSWHRSEGLAGWLDAFNETTRNTKRGPIIEVAPLPTSSQFLNVIEGVFSGMMRAIVNNSDYQSDEEMKVAMSRHLWERNLFFRENPKRVGKKIWEIDFFLEEDNLRSGNYRDW
jgi:transposase